MNEEKSLDEALDEFDRWEDRVARAIEALSPDEVVEYFRKSRSRLEQRTGKQLNLTAEPARHTTVA